MPDSNDEKKEWKLDYPDAQTKIDYYDAIIKELEGYWNTVNTELSFITQESHRATVENNTSDGPYYKTFLKHKENWFDALAAMKSKLDTANRDIQTGISDANAKKSEWENKKNMGHWE